MSVKLTRSMANEDRQGKVSNDVIAIDATFTLDTSAYASADLLADVVELAGASLGGGRYTELMSVTIHDEDAQGVALDLIFSTASTTLGTLNSAPSISDANARNIVGRVPIATTDYSNMNGSKVASKTAIGLYMKTGANLSSLWVGLLNGAGTPTFTAAGVRATFVFRRH